jgi:hypothetical protein
MNLIMVPTLISNSNRYSMHTICLCTCKHTSDDHDCSFAIVNEDLQLDGLGGASFLNININKHFNIIFAPALQGGINHAGAD